MNAQVRDAADAALAGVGLPPIDDVEADCLNDTQTTGEIVDALVRLRLACSGHKALAENEALKAELGRVAEHGVNKLFDGYPQVGVPDYC